MMILSPLHIIVRKLIKSFHGKMSLYLKFILHLENQFDQGIFHISNGKIELRCGEQSLEKIQNFQLNRNHIENANDLLRCLTSSLEILSIVGNFSEQVDFKLLKLFINLTSLMIGSETSSSMDFGFNSIENCTKYLDLCLDGNNVGKLKSNTFENLTKLKILSLRNTNLLFDV